jgi:hypothetical protein
VKKLMPGLYWLIVKGEAGPLDVLRTSLASGKQALPVFSFEEEARVFLEFGALDGGWRVRVTTVGELISIMSGPYAGVGWVALDPLPGPDGTAWNGLLSVEREAFMEFAVNQGYGGIRSSTGSGNLVGGSPNRDRVGTKHGRSRRSGQRLTVARQAGRSCRRRRLQRGDPNRNPASADMARRNDGWR